MRTLKELKKYTLARYQAKAADDLRFRGVDQGGKISHAISKGGDMRKTDPDIEKRSRKLDKRVIGIGKAGRKLAAGGYTGGVGPESPTGKMHNEGLKLNEFEMETTEINEEDEAYAKIHSFHAHPDGKFTIGIKHKPGRFADERKVMHTGTMQHLQKVTKRYPLTGSVSVHSVKTGRENIKEGHSKKKYLRNLKMTMNQATLGDMSTALQKGGFQGKGQYEEVELTEGLPKFGEAKQGMSFIATKTHDDKNHTKHDVHMVHTMLGLGHSLADREKSTTRERIGHIVKDKKTGQHIATATHKDFKTGKRLNNKMKPVDRHHDARAALQQSYFRGSFFEEVEYIVEKNVPNNPKLWSRAKSLAKQKFDVYPSAYANGWAARWYKSKGGTWRKGK